MPAATTPPSHVRHGASTARVFRADFACIACAEAAERALRAHPHVTDARVDYPAKSVHVAYHDGMVSAGEIQSVISGSAAGCRCAPADEPGDAVGGGLAALAHHADMAAVTMGTSADRMQYEFPSTAAGHAHHAEHTSRATPAPSLHADHRVDAGPASTSIPAPDHATHGRTASPPTTAPTGRAAPSAPAPATGHAGHETPSPADAAHAAHGGARPPAPHGDGSAAADAHATQGAMGHDMSDPRMAKAMEADMRRRFFVALLLTVPAVLFSPLAMNTFGIELVGMQTANRLMLLFATPVVWWAGWPFIGGAVTSLRYRALNMSVLIATGVLAAWGFSLLITLIEPDGETFYEAAAMLVTFVLFGHWMEMKSRRGTTDALRALLDLVPPTAAVIRDGIEVELPTDAIVAGDRVRLRPGDKVPVDGVVIEGTTSIDESLVTGESLPVDKGTGNPVTGGSINRGGSIIMEATKVGADTALARIVALVQQAQSSKAPGQRLADRAAAYLVIIAVGSGIVTFLAWYLFGDETALVALTFAISAVVIACPDALGLATPTAVAVGTGLGAKHNILIKDAATLEGFSRTTAVVLDKTGTLTEGKPRLTDVVVAPAAGQPAIADEDELLRLVAAAEGGSEHPVARAIVEGAAERGLTLAAATDFTAIAGKGIRARVDGHDLLAGNAALLAEHGIDAGALRPLVDDLATGGKTPMYVAIDSRAAGVVAVADTVKPGARRLIPLLKNAGIEAVMMTGDNRRTAEAVARELGIDRVFAEVLPEQKSDYVRRLQVEGRRVAMVGDGVNDAPALAQADTGIAIGAGTDVAIETAKVVLMRSDPLDIIRAIRLSKATVRKMKQNLFWASIYNVLAIPVAAGVLFPRFGIMLRPEWSALLMSLSSIIVATNAVLLKRVDAELRRV